MSEKSYSGVGWPLRDDNEELYTPKDINDAISIGKKYYGCRGFSTALNALKEIKPDDLIWTRHDGIYYLCRVLSKWKYSNDEEHVFEDVCHYVDVNFVEVLLFYATQRRSMSWNRTDRSP